MDLGTIVPIYVGFSAQAGIKNLFDKDYYYTAGYPEPGRSWYFNMRYRF
jgi:iron complex outermembrane receptor protein